MPPAFTKLRDWLSDNEIDASAGGAFVDELKTFIQQTVPQVLPKDLKCHAVAGLAGQRDVYGTLHVRLYLRWRGSDFSSDPHRKFMATLSRAFDPVSEKQPIRVDAQVVFLQGTSAPTIQEMDISIESISIIEQEEADSRDLPVSPEPEDESLRTHIFGVLPASQGVRQLISSILGRD